MTAAELQQIRSLASPLGGADDLDPLLQRCADARIVCLGEASHGTHEYYAWRAAISRRLIAEHGFDFVAVEGDWPDCFTVNRWVKGVGDERTAGEVLTTYERWPTWMWANAEVAEFTAWLADHNRATGPGVGFYGLDVYSLWESLDVLLEYLQKQEPDSVAATLRALACFEPFGEDPQAYALSTRLAPEGCEDEVVELLVDWQRRAAEIDGDSEAALDAVQNAEVARGAERYYRTMVRGGSDSWNIRDIHMADTLDRLLDHHGPDSKAIVWEHNTHVGDARATDMAVAGMVNVGQLVRERHGEERTVLIGFAGHHGTVVAGDSWGGPQRTMEVPPAPPGTHEALLHEALGEPSLLVLGDREGWLGQRRGHRAIGVVYRPRHDHLGNWVPTVMGARYDALLSFDETQALTPLEPEEGQPAAEQTTWPWSA